MPCSIPSAKCGIMGFKFGKLGGRPKGKIKSAQQPYGMDTTKYNEIVQLLTSPKGAPVYPKRMRGGSSRLKTGEKKRDSNRKKSNRKDFRKRCAKYTVEKSVLYRYVKFGTAKKESDKESSEGIMYKVRVARREDVNDDMFREFHHEKGHIGQRQGRETLRRH